MGRRKKPRVFLGIAEIAGFYKGLEIGFNQLDYAVTRLDLSNHPFAYSQEKKNFFTKIYLKARKSTSTHWLNKKFWKFVAILSRLILFLWYLIRHDIFIFAYGTSFLRLHDLWILKFFKKKIIFQFHGSDSRPPYVDGTMIPNYSMKDISELARSKKGQIKKINRYADGIIDIPPMGLLHERPFINWMYIGLTVSVTSAPPVSSVGQQGKTIKILHAPSNPTAKGTPKIILAVNKLREEGYPLELILIKNQPNQKVREALQECDFVVDQLYADFGLPGLATEAAWYGKPTIICGYANKLWRDLLSPENLPPSHYCHPLDLEKAIRLLCDDQKLRLNLGHQAFQFVSQKWSPKAIAERYLKIAFNDVPKEWYCDPYVTDYINGCCIEESNLKKYLEEFIAQQGISALQLKDKPNLEKKFLTFSGFNSCD